ncbi:MAG: hypothetical protein EB084_04890 [Proteobacteria bacterium]|nr:hypothetical protein [Pseudomonadota bacterium]
MNVHPASTLRSTTPRSVRFEGEPSPDPVLPEGSEPPAEGEAIDFSTIDTPQKAALLPALNGASLAVNLATLQAEAKWEIVVTSLQQATLNNAMGESVRMQGASSKDSVVSLSGSGQLGEVPIEETWTLNKDNGVLTIEGTIGYSHESLELHGADDGTQVLEGTIGDVAVREVFRRDDGLLALDGTLGGVEHHQAVKIDEDRMPMQPPLVFKDALVVDGMLGDAPITLHVDAVCPQHVPAVTYAGTGSIAGVAVESNQTLQITPIHAHASEGLLAR